MTHPLDDATTLTGENGNYKGRTTDAYANMVGPYGGLIAAVLLKGALIHPEAMGDPVAITVNFVAPVTNGDFDIKTRCVRTNRSNQHWYVELSQEGRVAANATAILAKRRETWGSTEITMPEVPGPETVDRLGNEYFPKWMGSYDMRIVKGAIPGVIPIEGEEPYQDAKSSLWMKDYPERPLDFISLTALCDIFFPRIYVRREGFEPAGTVSFTAYLHADQETLKRVGSRYLRGDARAQKFFNTYFDQSAEVWAPDGTLLATTHQVVYFK